MPYKYNSNKYNISVFKTMVKSTLAVLTRVLTTVVICM